MVVYFFPAGVLFSTENAIKTAFSKVYSGNTNINMPNKKHERKAKHQIRQKKHQIRKKKHQIRKKTPNMQKTPNTPKNFIYAVLSRKKFCSKFTHFVGVLFTDLKSMVVYQNGQISGMYSIIISTDPYDY